MALVGMMLVSQQLNDRCRRVVETTTRKPTTSASSSQQQQHQQHDSTLTGHPSAQKIIRGSHAHGGIVFFMHVPKTGGNAMGHNLMQYDDIDYVFLKGSDPLKNPMSESVVQGVSNNTILFFKAHTEIPSFLQLAADLKNWRQMASQNGVPFFAFTMLRDPIAYAVSAFEYVCVPCKAMWRATRQ